MTGVSQKTTALMLLIIFAIILATPITVHASEKTKTYIIYDSPERFGGSFPLVTSLIEYLGHFNLDCRQLPLDAWQPGALANADLIVFVGINDTVLPRQLLQELAQAKRVIWFEKNIEQMAAQLKWQDFKYEGTVNGWTSINYQKDFLIKDWMNIVIAYPGSSGRIIATVNNAHDRKPLAWQRDNIYYCGYLEVNARSFVITLANLLHEFIPGHNHASVHRALLRIEDVSPLVDPKAVRSVIEVIKQYQIPYAIGVIPVGVPQSGKHIPLHQAPELVKVLKDAQENGASIIMHGYSHQNEFSPRTGEGYEFWNARDDKPMDNDAAFTEKRLETGIAELVRCGLIPVAFEPPHYAMTKVGYQVLSRYFNVFSGVIQISDKSAQLTLSLPYITESNHLNGMLVFPENMGYYDGKTFFTDAMLQISEQLLAVRDSFAGFFYHGYLPPTKLPVLIEGVQKQGYTFYDLRLLPIKVQSSQVTIVGQNGQFQVTIDKQLQDSWKEPFNLNKRMKELGTVHVTILLIIIIIFILIIIRLKANRNKHYEV